jgi:hypothetical protein
MLFGQELEVALRAVEEPWPKSPPEPMAMVDWVI